MERTAFIGMKPMNRAGIGRRMMAGGEAGNILTALILVSPTAYGGWTEIPKQTKFVFTGRSGAGQRENQLFNGYWKQTGSKTLYVSTASEFRAAMN